MLRAVVGFTLLVQSAAYFSDWRNLGLDHWVAATLSMAAAVCLLAGILTPIASILMVVVTIGCAFSWIPAPAANLFDSKLVTINVIAMTIAILFMGPGAFSLDARFFGRREILIPRNPRSRNPDPDY